MRAGVSSIVVAASIAIASASIASSGCTNARRDVDAPSPSASSAPPSRRIEPIDVAAPTAPSSSSLPSSPTAASDAIDDALLVALRSAVILSGSKPVGTTSLVYKVPLDGGLYAAFKPDTKKHPDRWRAEVAAYRLARALHLVGVPPSVPRAAKLSALIASLGPGTVAANRLTKMANAEGDSLPGAMIAWLPGLRVVALEKEPSWSAWGKWLAHDAATGTKSADGGAMTSDDRTRALAPQIASMIAFDHLTGNVDRWSGGNVMVDETGTRLVFLDNNLAFLPAMPRAAETMRAKVLARVEKFSRSFIASVRALDRAKLVEAIGADHRGAPLLSEPIVDGVVKRREELLAHVDALIARYGEVVVLAFE